jgi:hypothetical protein
MLVLLLDRSTIWMWEVMPVFHRYMLPPSSGVHVSRAREYSCGYRFWANRPHYSLYWATGPNTNTVSPRVLVWDGDCVYLWNIGSTAHSYTVLRHKSRININNESQWKPEIVTVHLCLPLYMACNVIQVLMQSLQKKCLHCLLYYGHENCGMNVNKC